MRPDQLARMRDLEEKLADRFIDEADPDTWNDQDRKELYRQKREATETAQLLARVQALMAATPHHDRRDPNDEKEAERLINRAALRAQQAVDAAMKRAKTRAQSAG